MTYQELLIYKEKFTYGDLLSTTEWKSKRREILEVDRNICTNCKNSKIYNDLTIGLVTYLHSNLDVLYQAMKGKEFVKQMTEHSNDISIWDIELEQISSKLLITTKQIPSSLSNLIPGKKVHASYFKTDPNNISYPLIFNRIYEADTNLTIWENEKYVESSLHIHHNFYMVGQLPWEYPKEALRTLCRVCHNELHANRKVPIYGMDKTLTFCSRCSGEGWLPEFSYYRQGKCFRCETACYDELIGKNLKSLYPKK